jgi:ankyrin repeat protein
VSRATARIIGPVAVLVSALLWGQTSHLDSSLLTAAEAGNIAQVRSLLKQGANANAARAEGNTLTALMLAARGGHSGVVRLLLEAGAQVEATASIATGASGVNKGLTALMEAVASGDTTTVELLLSHGANPNAKAIYEVTDSNGTHTEGCRPAIMHATDFPVLQLLAEHGADLQVKDCDGNSVLMFAAEHLNPDAVRYVLAKGLDPRERNRNGQTALDLAKEAEKTGNIAVLEEAAKR